MGDLSKDFSKSEFKCSCGCDKVRVSPHLVKGLQKMRDGYGKPIKISSGFRCDDHNDTVGGAQNSAHLTGDAADMAVSNSKQRFALIREAIYAGFTRIGIAESFIHVDVSISAPQNVCWTY